MFCWQVRNTSIRTRKRQESIHYHQTAIAEQRRRRTKPGGDLQGLEMDATDQSCRDSDEGPSFGINILTLFQTGVVRSELTASVGSIVSTILELYTSFSSNLH
jgi:hypothetical protein